MDKITPKFTSIKNRSIFVRGNLEGEKFFSRNFILVKLPLKPEEITKERLESGMIPVGFTASKKVGNSVKRNFAKRRMRALLKDALKSSTNHEICYFLIAKPGMLIEIYANLAEEIEKGLKFLNK